MTIPATHRVVAGVLGAITVGSVLMGIGPAVAAPSDSSTSFERIARDTDDWIRTRGADIVSDVTRSDATQWQGQTLAPADSTVRYHFRGKRDTGGNYYLSVRAKSTGELIAGVGRNARDGYWITPTYLDGASWAPLYLQARNIDPSTVVTQAEDGVAYPVDLPRSSTFMLPNAAYNPLDWCSRESVRVTRLDGGRTKFTLSCGGDGEADDQCRYPTVTAITKAGYITSTRWDAVCSDGTSYQVTSKVSRKAKVKGAPAPRISSAEFFTAPVQAFPATWNVFTEAVTATANTANARPTTTNSNGFTEDRPSPTDWLSPAYLVIKEATDPAVEGRQGTGTLEIDVRSADSSTGLTTWTPSYDGATMQAESVIQSMSVSVNDEGLITKLVVRYAPTAPGTRAFERTTVVRY